MACPACGDVLQWEETRGFVALRCSGCLRLVWPTPGLAAQWNNERREWLTAIPREQRAGQGRFVPLGRG